MGIVSVSSSDDSDDQLSDVDSHMTLSSMGSHRAGIILGGFGDGQVEPEPNNDPARVSLNGKVECVLPMVISYEFRVEQYLIMIIGKMHHFNIQIRSYKCNFRDNFIREPVRI